MSIEITRVDTNHVILHDGTTVVVSESRNHITHNVQIKSDMAKAIYKALTSFDVALAIAKNRVNKPARQTYVIDDGVSELSDLASAVLDLNSMSRLHDVTLFVSSSVGALTITGDTLLALERIIKDTGAEADPTFNKYRAITFSIDAPDTRVMEDGVCYVLSNDYKEYPVDTVFMVQRDGDKVVRCIFDPKTGDLNPTAYGDPTDAKSYPYTPDFMDIVSGSIGDAETKTTEVVNSFMENTTTVVGAESVNIVNCDGEDACIKVTIA